VSNRFVELCIPAGERLDIAGDAGPDQKTLDRLRADDSSRSFRAHSEGADGHSNNTGELQAMAKVLLWSDIKIILCLDSVYVATAI
jgi:hypothetical protein